MEMLFEGSGMRLVIHKGSGLTYEIIIPHMQPLSELFNEKEKNLRLATDNPVTRGGFTQVPNFILKDPKLSMGAKVAYSMFLSYAWNNDCCFPGQERLAHDMGMSRPRVSQFIGELETAGLITIQRRGQGKTNLYTIHFQVKWANPSKRSDVGRPTS
jgi:biotin operon repressor